MNGMETQERTVPQIELRGLSKVYQIPGGEVQALNNINLAIEQGDIYGIIGMSGAGKTTVMVTLETGEEAIYALDTQSGEMQSQQTHVLLEDGSALTETVCLPQVCGVAVLCEGGGDIRVAARITELVSALLDLPSNRICVEQRKG